MSDDDVQAEHKMAGVVHALTDLPLVGLTVGTDGTWSGRMLKYRGRKTFGCCGVRLFGASENA